jgi:replicative DNA helicase|tara:strand:+ start:2674 stop:3909 length:1236 start_codon:yes stop_codon:yes gene_type:complete
MELALLRSLLDKEFYDNHIGVKCPPRLFTKDAQKIKSVVDYSMDKYKRSLTVDEVEAVFMVSNPTLTTAQKESFTKLFSQIKKELPMGNDVADDVLSKLFQQVIGEDIANLGFEYVNGTQTSLEPLRQLLDNYNDNFLPDLNVEWEDISIEAILAANTLESRWAFNIPVLNSRVKGVNAGHLIEVGARPNTGKTSFHANALAGPGGFAKQGAKCVVLVNEEAYARVGARYLTSCSGMDLEQIHSNKELAHSLYDEVRGNIFMKDSTGKDMSYVESVCKSESPDVVVLDMGDKFARPSGNARTDEVLKENAIHARQIAKVYNCAMFYMSQLSAEAEGKIVLNQAMMEGSRTGKAAEADLMILIAKNPQLSVGPGDAAEEDPMRHLNIAKNKLTGWHGTVHCNFDYKTARYSA